MSDKKRFPNELGRRLAEGKRETVKTWLARNKFDPNEIQERQAELLGAL